MGNNSMIKSLQYQFSALFPATRFKILLMKSINKKSLLDFSQSIIENLKLVIIEDSRPETSILFI